MGQWINVAKAKAGASRLLGAYSSTVIVKKENYPLLPQAEGKAWVVFLNNKKGTFAWQMEDTPADWEELSKKLGGANPTFRHGLLVEVGKEAIWNRETQPQDEDTVSLPKGVEKADYLDLIMA